MNNVSLRPCPICKTDMFITGKTSKNESLTSCGCKFSFKKTRSQKELDRKYIKTDSGYEIIERSK